ncbi:MAG: transcriptional regulator NrdR [Firmicutes bacterium]|nr:transcriptional regulator NrdR [Bacillota bacterium]
MKCIYCGNIDSKVIDSRVNDGANSIRRRRECINCGKRFTSYETVEVVPMLVVKMDGTREPFNAIKIKTGIVKSCEKRPVTMTQIDALVADIERNIANSLEQEISSKVIGEMVMSGLKKIDEIAYVRFAAVYKQFKDISSLVSFVKNMETK